MDDNAGKAVPLTKAYDPPVSPPDVELQAVGRWSSGGRAAGGRLRRRMDRRRKLERLAEALPIPWPEPVAVDPAISLFVSFGAVPMPQFVDARVFGETVKADGTPTGKEPMATVECAQSDPGTRHCLETRDGNVGVALHLPPGGVRHITVWASWDIPVGLSRRLGVDSNNVYGAWLFKTSGYAAIVETATVAWHDPRRGPRGCPPCTACSRPQPSQPPHGPGRRRPPRIPSHPPSPRRYRRRV